MGAADPIGARRRIVKSADRGGHSVGRPEGIGAPVEPLRGVVKVGREKQHHEDQQPDKQDARVRHQRPDSREAYKARRNPRRDLNKDRDRQTSREMASKRAEHVQHLRRQLGVLLSEEVELSDRNRTVVLASVLDEVLVLFEEEISKPRALGHPAEEGPVMLPDGTVSWDEEAHREGLVASFRLLASDRRRKYDAEAAKLIGEGVDDDDIRLKLGARPPDVGPLSMQPAESLVRLMEARGGSDRDAGGSSSAADGSEGEEGRESRKGGSSWAGGKKEFADRFADDERNREAFEDRFADDECNNREAFEDRFADDE